MSNVICWPQISRYDVEIIYKPAATTLFDLAPLAETIVKKTSLGDFAKKMKGGTGVGGFARKPSVAPGNPGNPGGAGGLVRKPLPNSVAPISNSPSGMMEKVNLQILEDA